MTGGMAKLTRKYVYGPRVDEPIRMTTYTSPTDLNSDGVVDIADARLLDKLK